LMLRKPGIGPFQPSSGFLSIKLSD
jgi:hypothetical protein